MKRSLRRHHTARLKRNRAGYWAGYAASTKRASGMVVATPKACSCWMCGNARKYHGVTYQERKFQEVDDES